MSVTDQDAETVDAAIEALLLTNPVATTEPRDFLAAQFDAGLAWVDFPKGNGGLGLPRELRDRVFKRLEQAGAPDGRAANRLAYSMAAPTLLAWGTREQHERHLRPIFLGEERWCQLFSEPGAGSDLAAIGTRAVRVDDGWLVNGQKVWTSMANVSQVGMLLARTDPEVPKHRGLTYFALDLSTPGVEVRPLRQMTGEAEFYEVYLTDVHIPDSARIGQVSEGWKVAMATLMNERTMFGTKSMDLGPAEIALQLYRERGERVRHLRPRVIDAWIQARLLVSFASRRVHNPGSSPGPENSISKIGFALLNQRGYELCLDLIGDESLLYESYAMREYSLDAPEPDVRTRFLRSRANSIEGGTTEIMRTILAERVLGLPAEPRVDKDVPYSRIPRG
ncbi:acyl-CoA dehydrogenase family protein [Amycolatopsis sp. GM8]|uniref:acyl-CoA dehydrogenase family protein n=1 Tax=Amycolatopsis sp. GM8 TaxID=2896530 RepID=UPI001F273C8E|nr:acyl-CoA dehydrogenase family protein [Amycolatopsis sp. GM8]